MKRILTFFALAAMVMPVSCIKDDLAGPEMGNGSGKGMKFTAVMEVPGSKTAINVSDDGSVASVAWMAGDALKFDYAIGKTDSDPVISSNLAEEDIVNGSATFFAQIPQEFSLEEDKYTDKENPRYLYAAYPASLETTYTTAGNAYHLVIPTVQDGSFANASISVAKWNSAEPTAALEFKNLCGLISLTVGNNVRQIKLSSSGYIAGNANVGFDPVRVKNLTEGAASKEIIANVEGEGIYYIAVAPGTIKDLYIEFFDAEGKAVCDKLAKGDVTVERAHILPLGGFADGSFAAQGGYFVKPEACGAEDGSSWDNAADYETFRSKLAAAVKNETAVVYMAGGTYNVTAVANVSAEGKNYKIYGGYPANATGVSLSGRDVVANPTIFKSDGESHRAWNFKYGTYLIDGVSFKDFSYSDGGALQIQLSTNVTCKNCVFENCKGTKNGGAVYFGGLSSSESVFENCVFIGNSTDGTTSGGGYGGAVGAFGTANEGKVTFKECLFKDNNAKISGGAVASRVTSMRFTDCNFIDNVITPKAGNPERSSSIFVDGSAIALSIYCDRCYFANSNGIDNANASIISNKSTIGATVCINNSVVTGYWGYGNAYSVVNIGTGKIVISNSTLIAQQGAIVYSNNESATTAVVNSIVGNASGGMISFKSDSGTINVYNSVCSATKIETQNSATNLNIRTDAETAVKFPTDKTPWITGAANELRENNNTMSTSVSDCRQKVYFYDWDGTYPSDVSFTNATLTQVTEWVNTADANFATWLGANSSDPNDNRLGKDIRGNARNAASMWPGSYQE